MEIQELDLASIDHVLTTTRAVRRRLDLDRPVEPSLLKECIEIACQAPTGIQGEMWHFVVVTDQQKRAQLADIYRRAVDPYNKQQVDLIPDDYLVMSAQRCDDGTVGRIMKSSTEYTEHLEEVPAFIVACVEGRMEDKGPGPQASMYGSIFPAVWSLQLALRARGLGSALTTVHIALENEVAQALDIPPDITQAALLPVAYFTGKDFKRGQRKPSELCTHWNSW